LNKGGAEALKGTEDVVKIILETKVSLREVWIER
jgi:hypothetical protein